jgi:hypothetical protein
MCTRSVPRLAGIAVFGTFLAAGSGLFLLAAPQAQPSLPKVVHGSAPFYPRIAAAARIEGVVLLRVSTDGERVSKVDVESGPPLLVRVATENVKTWEFEPHSPTSFRVRFRYKLSRAFTCDGGCGNCRHLEEESVLLQLPTDVELNANIPIECDPAVTVEEKK